METSNKWTGPTLLDLMSYAEDTPVSPSASPVRAKVKKTRGTSGLGYEKPYAFFDPVTQSLKMYEATCPLAALPSLEKLPPSGMTRSGVLFLQPPWEPITDATESSSWPTPTACEWKGRGPNSKQQGLAEKVKMWPTPTAVNRPMEGNVRLYRAKIEAGEMTEEEATQILGKSPFEAQGKIPATWPTPQSNDAKNAVVRHREKSLQVMLGGALATSEPSLIGGRLNPTWVEWLMGFPTGWTDLKASETPSSPK